MKNEYFNSQGWKDILFLLYGFLAIILVFTVMSYFQPINLNIYKYIGIFAIFGVFILFFLYKVDRLKFANENNISSLKKVKLLSEESLIEPPYTITYPEDPDLIIIHTKKNLTSSEYHVFMYLGDSFETPPEYVTALLILPGVDFVRVEHKSMIIKKKKGFKGSDVDFHILEVINEFFV